ncbi:hypothetical protein F4781DRAFT_417856 [Annulohypoxylon bovei var. microspora]|nr:hypothetical protein F4781DRAFT_417856 [Annulohypoxylon bovei var. microspora]
MPPFQGVVSKIQMPHLPRSGWRKTAVINTILAGVLAVVLIAFSIAAARISGSFGNAVFWSGSCNTASTVNLALHFLLNAVSTAILASSNFFMQVLSSPSRPEVNAAHAKKTWTDIGISSVRNLQFLSAFKIVFWIMFVLTSVPIHLVFNSSIFEIGYASGRWTTTLASESFVSGTPYYPPGASFLRGNGISVSNYGSYFDESSSTSLLIQSTAANASKWTRLDTHTCKSYIDSCEPLAGYRDIVMVMNTQLMNALNVSTVSSTADGWIPNDIFNMKTNFNLSGYNDGNGFNFTDLGIDSTGDGNFDDFWTQYMPLDSPNSLWYTTACSRQPYSQWKDRDKKGCIQSCSDVALTRWPNRIGFPYYNDSYSDGQLQPPPRVMVGGGIGYLNTSYCLAEPFNPTCMMGASVPLLITVTVCVLLKTLLSVAVVYRLREPVLATPGDAIASFIEHPDPTTVGQVTLGQPTLGLEVLQMVKRLEGWHFDTEAAFFESVLQRPRPWRKVGWSGLASVRRSAWLSGYLLIGGLFAAACSLFYLALRSYGSLSNSLRPVGEQNEATWASRVAVPVAIVMTNAPQLILTVGYFTYNSMFTRLIMVREWFSYAGATRPLRVTDPHGEQISTYRLQLPYRYSVPLLVLSSVLHWMVSNTLYIVIVYGDFYPSLYKVKGFVLDGVPANVDLPELRMQVAYSTRSILVSIIIAAVFAPAPLLMGLRRIKDSNMVGFPSNSLVMSAACHVSTVEAFLRPDPANRIPTIPLEERDVDPEQVTAQGQPLSQQPLLEAAVDIEMSDLGANTPRGSLDSPSEREDDGHTNDSPRASMDDSEDDTGMDEENTVGDLETALQRQERRVRLRISRSRLRWGEVQMPPSFREQWEGSEGPVGHLSFGTERQWLGEPKEGRLYI